MKKTFYYYLYGILGFSAIWLFIDHIAGFQFPTWFYNANKGIVLYSGVNVVSAWADLSFFTYHTLVLFGLWGVFLFLSHIFNLHKLEFFLLKYSAISIVISNYITTTFLYTLFELTGSRGFGYYGPYNLSIHSLGTNIIAHYLFFIFVMLIPFIAKLNKSKGKKHFIILVIYLLLYVLTVKITGMYCYIIEWYPYSIFKIEFIYILILGIIASSLYPFFVNLVGKIINKIQVHHNNI